jgi:methionine aminopeptidase
VSTRTGAAGAINGVSTAGEALPATATGVQLTYTCPAGKQAVVRFVSIDTIVNAITIAVEAVIGGVNVEVTSFTANGVLNCTIPLNAGDVVQLDVTVAIAGGAFDALIGAEEYTAA